MANKRVKMKLYALLGENVEYSEKTMIEYQTNNHLTFYLSSLNNKGEYSPSFDLSYGLPNTGKQYNACVRSRYNWATRGFDHFEWRLYNADGMVILNSPNGWFPVPYSDQLTTDHRKPTRQQIVQFFQQHPNIFGIMVDMFQKSALKVKNEKGNDHEPY